MIDRRKIKDDSGTVDLCETYSTDNYKLLQTETDITYGSSVIDVIEGYDQDGKPYSRFTYIETDEKDEPPAPVPEEEATAEDYEEALERFGVK